MALRGAVAWYQQRCALPAKRNTARGLLQFSRDSCNPLETQRRVSFALLKLLQEPQDNVKEAHLQKSKWMGGGGGKDRADAGSVQDQEHKHPDQAGK